jgi:hypothetical protein
MNYLISRVFAVTMLAGLAITSATKSAKFSNHTTQTLALTALPARDGWPLACGTAGEGAIKRLPRGRAPESRHHDVRMSKAEK